MKCGDCVHYEPSASLHLPVHHSWGMCAALRRATSARRRADLCCHATLRLTGQAPDRGEPDHRVDGPAAAMTEVYNSTRLESRLAAWKPEKVAS